MPVIRPAYVRLALLKRRKQSYVGALQDTYCWTRFVSSVLPNAWSVHIRRLGTETPFIAQNVRMKPIGTLLTIVMENIPAAVSMASRKHPRRVSTAMCDIVPSKNATAPSALKIGHWPTMVWSANVTQSTSRIPMGFAIPALWQAVSTAAPLITATSATKH